MVFSDGLKNRFLVEREQGAEVDDFGFDAFLGEGFGGFERSVHHRGVGNDGEVFSFAADDGFAERHGVIACGNFFLQAAVEKFVLEEKNRIVVADAAFSRPLAS